MRMANKILSMKKIWPYFFLLILCDRSHAQQWYWGVEGSKIPVGQSCTRNVQSQPGFLSNGRWFNYVTQYDNGWVASRPQKFYNWQNTFSTYPMWCFEGSMATVCLHYNWPVRSCLNGLFNKQIKDVDHTWKYSDIQSLNWRYGNADSVRLTSPPSDSYNSVANEIGRLYFLSHIACNVDYNGYANYGKIFGTDPDGNFYRSRMMHVMRSRLGYSNAKYLSMTDCPFWEDTLRRYIVDKNQPVMVYGVGHCRVFDGFIPKAPEYADYTASPIDISQWCELCHTGASWVVQFPDHMSHYYCHDHASPYRNNFHNLDCHAGCSGKWRKAEVSYPEHFDNWSSGYFIYDLDPTVTVPGGQTKMISYYFGRRYVPNTENSLRAGCFRIKNAGTPSNQPFLLSATEWHWNGSQWVQGNSLIPSTSMEFQYSSQELTSTAFHFPIESTDSIQIRLSIENQAGSNLLARIILDDKETGLRITNADEMKFFLDGKGNTVLDSVMQVTALSGLIIKNQQETGAAINNSSKLETNGSFGYQQLSSLDGMQVSGSLVISNQFAQRMCIINNDGIYVKGVNKNKTIP